MNFRRAALASASAVILSLLTACGGGGGSTSSTTPTPGSAQPLTITTPSILTATVRNHSYSTTLIASGGTGALHWTMAPISPTELFTSGLTIDASTGVVSGTANFGGTGGFMAMVTDSATPANSTSQAFTITAYAPLTAPAAQTINATQYSVPTLSGMQNAGGVPPYKFNLVSGSLPPGVKINADGSFGGGPLKLGSYTATYSIQDSYSPAESATEQVTMNVAPMPLSIEIFSLNNTQGVVNVPYNAIIAASGGTPPYRFSLTGGSLPIGLVLDANSGRITGTPTRAQITNVEIAVTDASNPMQTSSSNFQVSVFAAKGRNDTPATATPILANGQTIASLSPYEPGGSTPYAADHDYYRLQSLGGTTVHLGLTVIRGPMRGVLEVVDANGQRLTSCGSPGVPGDCISDGGATANSSLAYQVPGSAPNASTFYVHVFDWYGNARPDMNYNLQVTDMVVPLTITSPSTLAAPRNLPWASNFLTAGGVPPLSWTVGSGSLPPGLALNPSGYISGTATTDGAYSFVIKAQDSSNPVEMATQTITMQVVDRIQITSPALLPDACVNRPYSFTPTISGGAAPLAWNLNGSSQWPPRMQFDPATGTISGTIDTAGTYNNLLQVGDATHDASDNQFLTLNAKVCP